MTKNKLRQRLRIARREHVAMLPDSVRALIFHRPPSALLELVPKSAVIGLYRANPHEAPVASYAEFFFERTHQLALPRFDHRNAPMVFSHFIDPFEESDLEVGPFGLLQPQIGTEERVPDIVFVPLIGFTENGDRLGQGGGHYDRWLAAHPQTKSIGLAWDCQRVESLPIEPHDHRMDAIVTPTRLYGPFS